MGGGTQTQQIGGEWPKHSLPLISNGYVREENYQFLNKYGLQIPRPNAWIQLSRENDNETYTKAYTYIKILT